MANRDTFGTATDSPTASWACDSWFCLARGPFWVKNLAEAKVCARAHGARKFLGIWNHQAAVSSLHGRNGGASPRKPRQ